MLAGNLLEAVGIDVAVDERHELPHDRLAQIASISVTDSLVEKNAKREKQQRGLLRLVVEENGQQGVKDRVVLVQAVNVRGIVCRDQAQVEYAVDVGGLGAHGETSEAEGIQAYPVLDVELEYAVVVCKVSVHVLGHLIPERLLQPRPHLLPHRLGWNTL